MRDERKSYNTITESWNEYLVEDGTTIRIKLVVSDILQTDQFNADGTPIYRVKSMNVLEARVPNELRRRVD